MPFEVPDRISTAVPDSVRVAKIREAFVNSASPVRPLPSNGAMMLLCVGVFSVLAILFAAAVGFPGFAAMSWTGRAVDCAVVLLLTMVLAGSVVEQIIPGSRRIMSPAVGAILAILLLSLTATVMFPDFELHNFGRRGIPCLRLGVLCAIPAGALVAITMRRGFVLDRVPAAIAGGAFSGLLGVAVLALHCPVFNAAHIIVWHVGVIAVTSLFGALLGWGLARYR